MKRSGTSGRNGGWKAFHGQYDHPGQPGTAAHGHMDPTGQIHAGHLERHGPGGTAVTYRIGGFFQRISAGS